MLKPCVECGALSSGSRCPEHSRKPATHAERKRSVDMRAEWVARYGLVCPGAEGHAAHAVRSAAELTVDHIWPVANGGRAGAVRILCRSFNSARGNRV